MPHDLRASSPQSASSRRHRTRFGLAITSSPLIQVEKNREGGVSEHGTGIQWLLTETSPIGGKKISPALSICTTTGSFGLRQKPSALPVFKRPKKLKTH